MEVEPQSNGYKHTATFTFESGDPTAASFDGLAALAEIERVMVSEFGTVRSILVEVNGGES